MAKGKPDDVQKIEEISTAVTFAHVFVHNRKAIDDKMFDVLKQYWSEEEIVELCVYICFITASQQLGFLFQLQPRKEKDIMLKQAALVIIDVQKAFNYHIGASEIILLQKRI